MSNEFRPGHPVVFWTAMVLLVIFFFSVAKAGMTADNACNKGEDKQWVVLDFDWRCGASGIALRSSD